MASILLRTLASAACVLATPVVAQAPQPPNVSSYDMTAILQPRAKRVLGSQTIVWKNTTSKPTHEVWFHLYLNAFRDLDSTMMTESSAEFRSRWREGDFGGIELQSLQLVQGETAVDLAPRFVQPDDANDADRTVLVAELPTPVAPGGSITLKTRFQSQLPKAHRRTGWAPGDSFFCMQWYPKLGVFEERDGRAEWNCHQFHANTEFYADYSHYRVEIEVPANYVVGATGGIPVSKVERNGKHFITFEQDSVHDFAWVADPDYRVHQWTIDSVPAANDPTGVAPAVAAELGVNVADFDLPDVEVILLLRPEHDTDVQVERHMRAVRTAIRFFGLRYGPYPYRAITVVDPARGMDGRSFGGGMEYPTLITCGTDRIPHPRRLRPEGVTVHEFGHQYWYGLVANNEFEESWLDEGLTTYSEGRAQWLEYDARMMPVQTTSIGRVTFAAAALPVAEAGVLDRTTLPLDAVLPNDWQDSLDAVWFDGTVIPDSSLLDLMADLPSAVGCREARHSDRWNDRRRWLDANSPDAMVRDGWDYVDRASYVANSYHRPATLLRTMEARIGTSQWWALLRNYHRTARYTHPTTEDFVALLATECGEEHAEFFRLAIRAEAVFDYGVHSVTPESGVGAHKSVVVRRYGALLGNVDVRFTFSGRPDPVWREFRADEPYPWKRFDFHDAEGAGWGDLVEVWVDPPGGDGEARFGPCGEYLIDSNLLNNAWRANPDRAPAVYRGLRALLQAQQQLSFTGVIG